MRHHFPIVLAAAIFTACGGGSGNAVPPGGGGGPSHPTASPTPTPTPVPLHIYVSNSTTGSVDVFTLPLNASSRPTGTLMTGGAPSAMAFDSMHRLFVANGSIQVFAPPIVDGAVPSFFLYPDATPNDIKLDTAGDAGISGRGFCGFLCAYGFIDVFTAPVSNASTVGFEIKSPSYRFAAFTGIAFDRSGNLWAKFFGSEILGAPSGRIMKFAPPFSAASTPVLEFPDSNKDGGLAFDGAGRMYTAGANGIDVYAPPFTASTTAAFTINTVPSAYIAFDADGNLYSTSMNGDLLEFAPPFSAASSPIVTMAHPGGNSSGNAGIAIEP